MTITGTSAVTQTTATSGGNVTSDGGAIVTERGVCWSTSSNPTISNSKTNDGRGTGSFTSSITGLTASTTYYVRAYATNSAGTAYGSEVSFTTESGSDGSLIAHWKFDENSGTTAYDVSGNGNNGTLINDPVWTTGKFGNALSFNGSNYVDMGNKDIFNPHTGSFTISIWVKPNSVNVFSAISKFSRVSGYYLLASDGFIFGGYVGSNSRYCISQVWNGQWSHVAFVRDVNSVKLQLYVNGELKQDVPGNTDDISNDINLFIGKWLSDGYIGEIDDVRLYNIALSATDILALNDGTKSALEVTDISGPDIQDNYFNLNSYPNPFSSTVTIEYTLPETGNVNIDIYDITGRLVQTLTDEQKQEGQYSVQWNANDTNGTEMPNGTYFIRMQTGENAQTTKVILMR